MAIRTMSPQEVRALEVIALDFAGRGATIAEICQGADLTRGHAVMAVKRLGGRGLVRGVSDGAQMVYVQTIH